jgi:hypothetical protein
MHLSPFELDIYAQHIRATHEAAAAQRALLAAARGSSPAGRVRVRLGRVLVLLGAWLSGAPEPVAVDSTGRPCSPLVSPATRLWAGSESHRPAA